MKSITMLASTAVAFSLLTGCVVAPDPYYYGPVYAHPHRVAVYPTNYYYPASRYYYNDYYPTNYPYYYPASAISFGYYGGYGYRHGGYYRGGYRHHH
jgi:hypothetical protein